MDSLGDRMKFYEGQHRHKIIPALPFAVRVDGKGFHNWTKGLKRPFDEQLIATFMLAAQRIMTEITGQAVIAYGQSDEVTFVFPACKPGTQPFYGGKHDKICSIIASAFTVAFNNAAEAHGLLEDRPMAIFDARVFSLPSDEEVVNCLIWRQQDATRNSIQMVGQAYFSHKQLQNKNCNMIQDMLFKEHDINWNDMPIHQKRGWTIVRKPTIVLPKDLDNILEAHRPTEPIVRKVVTVDTGPPVFTADREYVLSLLQ